MLRVLAIMLLGPAVAHAEEPDGFAFVAPQLGFAAPLGLIGAELGVGYAWFRAAGGVGLGGTGLQVGGMLRAMTTAYGVDVGVGLGLSKGPGPGDRSVSANEDEPPAPTFGSDTYWTNAEVVVEVPLSTWSSTRFFAGASYAVGGSCEHDDGPCTAAHRAILEDNRWLPYVGVAAVIRFPAGPARQTFQLPGTPPPY